MPNSGNYFDRLSYRIRRRSVLCAQVRLRTLLRHCGVARRTSASMTAVRAQLAQHGLTARMSLTSPRTLDDFVVVAATTAPSPNLWNAVAAGSKRRTASLAQPSPSGVPTPERPSSTPSDIAERALAATVQIGVGEGLGAGVIIDAAGLVLTARHVVSEMGAAARRVGVRLADRTRVGGTVVWGENVLDLAMLWLDGDGPFAAIPLGVPARLRPAQPLLAIGHPMNLRNTVSRGIVSNPAQRVEGIEFIQTDAAIGEGNSGGPSDATEEGVRWFATDSVEAFAYAEMDDKGDVLLYVASEIMPVP